MLLLPLFPLVFLIASSQFVPFKVDHDGNLLPRASLRSVLDQQIEWYLKCGNASKTGGYATWISNAFMTGDCVPDGFAVLPGIGPSQALQAMVLYLSLPDSSNSSVSRRDVLDLANSLASYLVKETLTPNEGAWPGVPRSTGISAFPITVSAQADALYGPDTIEPDKAAMAGVALALFANLTNNSLFRNVSLHIASVLAKNIRWEADQSLAPFSFRVNFRTGVSFNAKMSNTAYVLRLFDFVLEEFAAGNEIRSARDFLQQWIIKFQVFCPEDPRGNLFVGFFEDFIDSDEVNRDSWGAMELARYILERQTRFHPQFLQMATHLFEFAQSHFGLSRFGNVSIMGEQDGDHKPWGGAASKLPAVASLLYRNNGPTYFKTMAELALNYLTYFVDPTDGCPAALQDNEKPKRGGWQQDAFEDKLVGIIVALKTLALV